jgi:hypothetical protein
MQLGIKNDWSRVNQVYLSAPEVICSIRHRRFSRIASQLPLSLCLLRSRELFSKHVNFFRRALAPEDPEKRGGQNQDGGDDYSWDHFRHVIFSKVSARAVL